MRGVRNQSALDAESKLLLVCLGLRANNDTGDSYPSIEQLVCDTSLGRATVLRRLGALESAGWLSVTRTGRSNRYRVVERNIDPTGATPTGTPEVSGGDSSGLAETLLKYPTETSEVSAGDFASGTTQKTTQPTTQREPARKGGKAKAKRRKPETEVPDSFDADVRPSVVAWALEKHKRQADWANRRLDLMVSKCKAKGYTYRDWVAAGRDWLTRDILDEAKQAERQARFGTPPGFQQHQNLVDPSRRPELQLFRPKPVPNPVSADEFARLARKL